MGSSILTGQFQTTLAAQLTAQAQAHREELQELVAECCASAHDARLAKAQLQLYCNGAAIVAKALARQLHRRRSLGGGEQGKSSSSGNPTRFVLLR